MSTTTDYTVEILEEPPADAGPEELTRLNGLLRKRVARYEELNAQLSAEVDRLRDELDKARRG